MKVQFQYTLDKSSRKFVCPDCNKKRFVRFIDNETGDYLPEQYGRCDKGDGHYFNYPKAAEKQTNWIPATVTPQPVFFNYETFKQTLQPDRYASNTFIQNLLTNVSFPFEADEVTQVIQLYRLGTITSGYRKAAVTFPFIDKNGYVRAIQVKQFDHQNHTTGTDFLHSMIEKHHTQNSKPLPDWLKAYIKQDKRVSCLFGEHLLSKYPSNPVALVEAPKTAIYGSLYFGLPETQKDLIWLAVYNKGSFTFDKLKVLQGRTVFVFPDLSKDGTTFHEWQTKAKDYETLLLNTRFIFSSLLEQLAPAEAKDNGSDIADFLIKQDWRLYRKSKEQQTKPIPQRKREPKNISNDDVFDPNTPPVNWSDEITELENYFAGIELPAHSIKLSAYTTIKGCTSFVEAHLATIKANNGKRTFIPYLTRLQELKEVI